MMKRLALAVVALAPLFATARTYEWSWRMPDRVYQNLEFTLRASVDRATKVFQQAWDAERRGVKVTDLVPQYRAAKAEWKKVQIQAEAEGFDESLLAYVIFMQGYAAARAHDRNEALKLYGEVVDLYPEETWIAYPARYFAGATRIDMGDVKAGEATLDDLIDLGAKSENPIIASALVRRAQRYAAVGKDAIALEHWKKVRPYKESIYWTWNDANNSVGAYASYLGDRETLDQALADRNDEKDAKKRLDRQIEIVNGHAWWYINGNRWDWTHPRKYFVDKYSKKSDRDKALAKFNAFMQKWALSLKELFTQAERPFEAEVLAFRIKASETKVGDLVKDVDRLLAGIKSEKNDNVKARLAEACAMSLAWRGAFDAAKRFPEVVPNPVKAAKLRYDIAYQQGDWKAVVLAIEEILAREIDPAAVQNWKYTLGWVYRDQLKDYEKAIAVYSEITDPPRQLWEISWAYRRAKKNKEAYRAVTEIASMFPKDAPEAVFRIAEWREQDGEKEKAIALYRRLLSQPEWKQSGASSRAHQALERLGVATGGAMTNTVR